MPREQMDLALEALTRRKNHKGFCERDCSCPGKERYLGKRYDWVPTPIENDHDFFGEKEIFDVQRVDLAFQECDVDPVVTSIILSFLPHGSVLISVNHISAEFKMYFRDFWEWEYCL